MWLDCLSLTDRAWDQPALCQLCRLSLVSNCLASDCPASDRKLEPIGSLVNHLHDAAAILYSIKTMHCNGATSSDLHDFGTHYDTWHIYDKHDMEIKYCHFYTRAVRHSPLAWQAHILALNCCLTSTNILHAGFSFKFLRNFNPKT